MLLSEHYWLHKNFYTKYQQERIPILIYVLFNDSVQEFVVVCLNTVDVDKVSLTLLDDIGLADKLLVLTNFKDSLSAVDFSKRYKDAGIKFLNFKKWPMLGRGFDKCEVFNLDDKGKVSKAFKMDYDDVEKLKLRIRELE